MANSVRVIPANDKSLMSSSQGYVIASFKTFVTYFMVFVFKWQTLGWTFWVYFSESIFGQCISDSVFKWRTLR